MVSNTIQIPYATAVQDTHFSFDSLLEGNEVDTTQVLSTTQDLGNTIALPSVVL